MYAREYYWKNRDKAIANSKKYAAENREKVLANKREYHRENRERLIALKKIRYQEKRKAGVKFIDKWAIKNPTLAKIVKRKSYLKHKTRHDDRSKRWAEENKEKRAAQGAVAYAILTGNLTRPSTCELCGRVRKIDAHHPDYTKQLSVMWLCRPCHIKQNKIDKKAREQ